jgi:hypothetical protein
MRGVPLFQKGFWDENMTLSSSGASQNQMKYVSSQINILHSCELCVSSILPKSVSQCRYEWSVAALQNDDPHHNMPSHLLAYQNPEGALNLLRIKIMI